MTELVLDDVWIPGASPAGESFPFSVMGVAAVRATLSSTTTAQGPRIRQARNERQITTLEFEAASGTHTVTILVAAADIVTLWRPGSNVPHGSVPPSWASQWRASAFNGVALLSAVGRDDKSILTVGARQGAEALYVRGGVVEESGDLLVSVEWHGKAGAPLTLIIDGDHRLFADSAQLVGGQLWGRIDRAPIANELPVYCTWYAMHLDVSEEAVLTQLREAAQLGFSTVIVDDGWQTAETGRGYGTAGDWKPNVDAFPNAARFVIEAKELGLRTLWWVGTPFIGHRSEAYQLDQVTTFAEEPELNAAVLDPRSPAAREHLIDRLVDLLETTRADGFKIDFLERFAFDAIQPEPADADQLRVEDAGLILVQEMSDRLKTLHPELMLEFREPYVNPAVSRFATMLRVTDCPLSPEQNRLGIVDLRLAAPGVAIHSDPVMWHGDASPERVAQHLANTLFGVPQVSVDLTALSIDHRNVLQFWLHFWLDNRTTLIHGNFRPHRPDLNYPLLTAEHGDVRIIGRYSPVTIDIDGDQAWRTLHIINADRRTMALRALTEVGPIHARVHACDGTVVRTEETELGEGLHEIDVPAGGLLTISR